MRKSHQVGSCIFPRVKMKTYLKPPPSFCCLQTGSNLAKQPPPYWTIFWTSFGKKSSIRNAWKGSSWVLWLPLSSFVSPKRQRTLGKNGKKHQHLIPSNTKIPAILAQKKQGPRPFSLSQVRIQMSHKKSLLLKILVLFCRDPYFMVFERIPIYITRDCWFIPGILYPHQPGALSKPWASQTTSRPAIPSTLPPS